MSTASQGPVPVRVRIGRQPDHLRWFRVVPRTGEWINFAPPGMPRDDYEVDWVLHWAIDPDDGEQPEVTIEIQLVEPDGL
ncbi:MULTISPECIES: hypothetical protein [Pseudonocardia]|uniref:Uncharacterized protein n=1 Tax=Pseudonocardia saturnea TaxID=33909 RepID=A0ABQ0S5K8_9PSEU|nr:MULTISPECIES: hypothetical protein [Pseudonocardia]BBG00843.1 hypothetical protein Pdca_20520 [Pseudonocardia autotrophica]GEC28187.1 hypothetical protein PSA01_52160 [Pseudonocardia saturnea]